MEFEYKKTFLAIFFTSLTVFFTFFLIFVIKKIYENCEKIKRKNTFSNTNAKKQEDPFEISFRKTRTESLIISRVEEIQKERDIQFVVSFYNYKDEKTIKGSMYIVTSKIVYKINFIKYNIVTTVFHKLNTFITKNNPKYTYLLDYFNKNMNCQKQKHHNEFYTWHYYFFNRNYELEQLHWEKFIKNM